MPEGIPIHLLPFREDAALGVMTWDTMLALLPDPRDLEKNKGLPARLQEYAERRKLVQRPLGTSGSAKAKNVTSYAGYIASGIRKEKGPRWSMPPLCLWSPDPIEIDEDGITRLPLGPRLIAIDGETQLIAMHRIYNDPVEGFKIVEPLGERRVPFEVYWDLTITDAQKIFHDRNMLGTPVQKNLALTMDSDDRVTAMATEVVDVTEVDAPGGSVALKMRVEHTGRQVKPPYWFTLNTLRSFILCTVFGGAGINMGKQQIDEGRLPEGINPERVKAEAVDITRQVIRRYTEQFRRGPESVIAYPSVMAGLGVASHLTTSWSDPQARLGSTEKLWELLDPIRWDASVRLWGGIAGGQAVSGALQRGGGVNVFGSRVANAILQPDSPEGQQIRK